MAIVSVDLFFRHMEFYSEYMKNVKCSKPQTTFGPTSIVA